MGNSIYTYQSNSNNKRRAVNLEEFRSRVRDPLEEVLRRGEAEIRELALLPVKPNFPGDFEEQIKELNRKLMGCMKEAEDRLMDADESRFSDDVNWAELYDPYEDQIMHSMNGALDETLSGSDRSVHIDRCRRDYRRFKKAVTTKIEEQVATLSG